METYLFYAKPILHFCEGLDEYYPALASYECNFCLLITVRRGLSFIAIQDLFYRKNAHESFRQITSVADKALDSNQATTLFLNSRELQFSFDLFVLKLRGTNRLCFVSHCRTLHKQGMYGGEPTLKRTLIVTPGSLVKVYAHFVFKQQQQQQQ